MKRITFSVEDRRRYNPNCESSTVNILIDDKPLAEILRAYELPMATKEGHPALAGDYHAIEVMASLEDYYLGKAEADWGDEENKTQLLGCSCGIAGCWPLLCKINVQGDTVVWSEFEQPHRDEDWDYSAFGVLEFDKQQYLEAVQAMQNL
ncbi:hypothetical protein [Woeseia oceani]|uniref:hypothetical protein n=1 Tax=Woeseia oceani TaxID=1548547 RepID=UPI0018D2CDD3|nr:hypothetical protein [Woeseia oceani]